MTITNQALRVDEDGDDVSVAFPFTMQVSSISAIVVLSVVIATDAETTEVEASTINTTLSGSPPGSTGGTVTFVTPPPSTVRVVIYLDPELTQRSIFPLAGPFLSTAVERALDKTTNLAKRTRDLVLRALKLDDGAVDGSGAYDANGNRIKSAADPTGDQDLATRIWTLARVAEVSVVPSVAITSAGAALIDDDTADDQLTTLGALSTGVSIFKSASASAAMTILGFSTFFKTLIVAASASAFRALIDAAQEGSAASANLSVNGDAQVWQNGESFSAVNDATYFADQFLYLSENAGSVDIARMTSSFPDHARGGIKVTQASGKADEKWAIIQIIESNKVIPMQGLKVSCSVDVLTSGVAAGDLVDMELHLLFWVGTADSPTIDVVDGANWGTAQVKPTLATSWDYVAGSPKIISATETWTTYSLENMSLPGNATNLAMMLVTSDANFAAASVLSTTNWNLVAGSLATQFRSQSYIETLRECQRFFFSTFMDNTAPVQNGGLEGAFRAYPQEEGANKRMAEYIRFPAPLIKNPGVSGITTYNPRAANASWVETAGTAQVASPSFPAASIDGNGISIASAAASITNLEHSIHLTADARF